MDKTPFAGLTRLDPDESIAEDNFSFQSRDPLVIDRLLQIGAVTHRHDAHEPLADPDAELGASAIASGGTLAAGVTVYLGYTLLDENGGETMISPIATITTDPPLDVPDATFGASADYGGGTLAAETYYYGLSIIDAAGGETPIGGTVMVTRDPGFASGQVLLDGLMDPVAEVGGAGWRLWRAVGGGDYFHIADGATDTFTDDGITCGDCSLEPVDENENLTNGTNAVDVLVPSGGVMAQASGFALYASEDPTFAGPSLVGHFPAASAGAVMTFTELLAEDARPPDVSTSIPGANKIDPDTELIDWHWKRPVPTVADLPSGAASGDVRVVLSDGFPRRFLDGAWDTWQTTVDGTVREVGDVETPASIQFVGSGGTTVDVAASGASAVVTITGGAAGGGGSTTSGTVSSIQSLTDTVDDPYGIQFLASGGAVVAVSDMGDGRARVLLGLDPAELPPGPDGPEGPEGPEGPAGPVGPSGSAIASRTTASATTASLASGAGADVTIPLAKGYRLLDITTSRAARVRLYATAADRTADVARAIGTDPTGDHGCYLDFVTTVSDLSWRLTPPVEGANMEAAPDANVSMRVTNLDAAGAVVVTFTYVQTES